MASNYADDARLLELYPELEGAFALARREVWLEVAKGLVFVDAYGNLLDAAHAAMTGHLLDYAGKAGGKKASSKSVGPASYTYAVAPPSSELAETKYGRDLLIMRRSRMTSSVVVAT